LFGKRSRRRRLAGAGVVVGVVMGRSGDARDEQRSEGVVLGKAARRRSQSGVNLEAGCGRRPFIPRFLGDASCRRVAERSGDTKCAKNGVSEGGVRGKVYTYLIHYTEKGKDL
jgi:hypothetical protein